MHAQHATTTAPPIAGTYPMPELAAACRALLATVDLADRWHDDGPDPTATAWLASAGQCRPVQLTADQWTMLRVCWGLWTGEGPLAALFALRSRPALVLSSYLAAQAVDGAALWVDAHRR